MTRRHAGAGEALSVYAVANGLYRVDYNGVVSDPVPWWRVTTEFVFKVMETYREGREQAS